MPAIYHEGSWLGNATDPEVLVKDTVGWTGKNRAYSQTNNAVIAHIENGITYDVSWTGSATVTLKKNSTSGATITSGSTSPLSFTADADYELYFGSSATVTNIMVKDSRITDPTYEPYHESVEEEIEQVYADNGVLGAKNLLEVTANSQTLSGVTFTVNRDSDGNVINVTVNGTATANINFGLISYANIDEFSLWTGKHLRLSGCPSGGSNSTYALEIYYRDGREHWTRDFGDGVELNIPVSGLTYINPNIALKNGVAVNNLVFKPMLRLASDPDDTYQPYAMTNRELTDGKADKTDLTSIIATGSTNATGSTITNGKYFYLNGTLVRAKADIASGATFTLNTNYEPVTAGSLNELSANKLGGVVDITSYTSSPYICPHDGILTIRASSQGAYCTASILGADGDNSKRSDVTVSAPTSTENDSCFNVKKGMQLYCRSKSGSAYLFYNPIV